MFNFFHRCWHRRNVHPSFPLKLHMGQHDTSVTNQQSMAPSHRCFYNHATKWLLQAKTWQQFALCSLRRVLCQKSPLLKIIESWKHSRVDKNLSKNDRLSMGKTHYNDKYFWKKKDNKFNTLKFSHLYFLACHWSLTFMYMLITRLKNKCNTWKELFQVWINNSRRPAFCWKLTPRSVCPTILLLLIKVYHHGKETLNTKCCNRVCKTFKHYFHIYSTKTGLHKCKWIYYDRFVNLWTC